MLVRITQAASDGVKRACRIVTRAVRFIPEIFAVAHLFLGKVVELGHDGLNKIAQELGADESGERFEKAFRKVVTGSPEN